MKGLAQSWGPRRVFQIIFVLLFLFLLGVLVHWQRSGYFAIENLRGRLNDVAQFARERPVVFAGSFFASAVLCSALAVPGLLILSLASGSLFGFAIGFLLVWLAAGVGASIAFGVSRFLLRDWVSRRFAGALAKVNAGLARDGTVYLLTLRLIPVFPAGLVNVLCGVTRVGVGKFFFASLLGMIPAVAIYVNAGIRLGEVASPRELISPEIFFSLAAIGCLPLLGLWLQRLRG